MKRPRDIWLLPLGGILTALCLLLPKIGFLEWVTLAPALFFLFRKQQSPPRLRRFYAYGLLFFFSFFFVIFHWFAALYPMEFAGATPAEAVLLIAICWIGLSLLQTVFFALTFPLYAWLAKGRFLQRWPILSPFVYAAIYALFEWGMTHTFAGVPWARLPIGQIEMGFLPNSAALFGTYFTTFLLVACNGLLAWLLLQPGKKRCCALLAAGLLALQVVTGAIGYATAHTGKGEEIVVAAVQGNIGSSQKWSGAATVRTKEVYEKYTAEAARAGAVLVVFPETFLPYSIDPGTSTHEYVRSLAMRYGVTIQCGGFHYTETLDEYNALFTIYPDGSCDQTIYKKRRLVPFGEFVPWRGFVETVIPPLADMGMLSADLSPGTDSEIVTTQYGRIGGLICFDSIYEVLTLDSVRDGAELITLATNDSWFTDSAAAYMHNAQARLRAIETDRYIVRAADTGISGIITPRGDVLDLKVPMIEGVAIAGVCFNTSRTLYSRIGNTFIYLLAAGLAALCATEITRGFLERSKRKEKNDRA